MNLLGKKIPTYGGKFQPIGEGGGKHPLRKLQTSCAATVLTEGKTRKLGNRRYYFAKPAKIS
jgi:hypothetical protein